MVTPYYSEENLVDFSGFGDLYKDPVGFVNTMPSGEVDLPLFNIINNEDIQPKENLIQITPDPNRITVHPKDYNKTIHIEIDEIPVNLLNSKMKLETDSLFSGFQKKYSLSKNSLRDDSKFDLARETKIINDYLSTFEIPLRFVHISTELFELLTKKQEYILYSFTIGNIPSTKELFIHFIKNTSAFSSELYSYNADFIFNNGNIFVDTQLEQDQILNAVNEITKFSVRFSIYDVRIVNKTQIIAPYYDKLLLQNWGELTKDYCYIKRLFILISLLTRFRDHGSSILSTDCNVFYIGLIDKLFSYVQIDPNEAGLSQYNQYIKLCQTKNIGNSITAYPDKFLVNACKQYFHPISSYGNDYLIFLLHNVFKTGQISNTTLHGKIFYRNYDKTELKPYEKPSKTTSRSHTLLIHNNMDKLLKVDMANIFEKIKNSYVTDLENVGSYDEQLDISSKYIPNTGKSLKRKLDKIDEGLVGKYNEKNDMDIEDPIKKEEIDMVIDEESKGNITKKQKKNNSPIDLISDDDEIIVPPPKQKYLKNVSVKEPKSNEPKNVVHIKEKEPSETREMDIEEKTNTLVDSKSSNITPKTSSKKTITIKIPPPTQKEAESKKQTDDEKKKSEQLQKSEESIEMAPPPKRRFLETGSKKETQSNEPKKQIINEKEIIDVVEPGQIQKGEESIELFVPPPKRRLLETVIKKQPDEPKKQNENIIEIIINDEIDLTDEPFIKIAIERIDDIVVTNENTKKDSGPSKKEQDNNPPLPIDDAPKNNITIDSFDLNNKIIPTHIKTMFHMNGIEKNNIIKDINDITIDIPNRKYQLFQSIFNYNVFINIDAKDKNSISKYLPMWNTFNDKYELCEQVNDGETFTMAFIHKLIIKDTQLKNKIALYDDLFTNNNKDVYAILKATTLPTLNTIVRDNIMNEIIVAYYLRLLIFSKDVILSPNFTISYDWFCVAPDTNKFTKKGKGDISNFPTFNKAMLFNIQEYGGEITLLDYIKKKLIDEDNPIQLLIDILFEVGHAIETADLFTGFQSNDLHLGNITLKKFNTYGKNCYYKRYVNNKPIIYKIQRLNSFIVKIIDYGKSNITIKEPRNPYLVKPKKNNTADIRRLMYSLIIDVYDNKLWNNISKKSDAKLWKKFMDCLSKCIKIGETLQELKNMDGFGPYYIMTAKYFRLYFNNEENISTETFIKNFKNYMATMIPYKDYITDPDNKKFFYIEHLKVNGEVPTDWVSIQPGFKNPMKPKYALHGFLINHFVNIIGLRTGLTYSEFLNDDLFSDMVVTQEVFESDDNKILLADPNPEFMKQ